MTVPNTELDQLNRFADYWRYDIGVNVIPADTRNKRPLIPWEEWQDKPIPEELHRRWKELGTFSKGIAIIPGKVWHRADKLGLYFIFLDADKFIAINELCTRNGTISIPIVYVRNYLIRLPHIRSLQRDV